MKFYGLLIKCKMKNKISFIKILTILFLCKIGIVTAQVPDNNKIPKWIMENRSMVSDSIPEEDYGYLSKWIADNKQPAEDYFVNLFQSHDLIVYGESHNIREHKDFIIKLIPRLYFEAGVRCIGWEFSTPSSDDELKKLVTSPTFDYSAQLDFARRQGSHAWTSKEHWDIIEAIRELNTYLPPDSDKLILVGLDKEIDWVNLYTKLKTLPKDSPELMKLLELEQVRDVEMAKNAERQTLAKGIKALLFVGLGHDLTHFGLPPDPPYRRPIMAQVLYKKYGARVYQVCPDWGVSPSINKAAGKIFSNPIGFDMPNSPFANILIKEMGTVPTRLQTNFRGYLYFGPRNSLHRNTFIEGFITDEMFLKYKRYYEIDFGKTFTGAQDVNDYFRQKALSVLK
jgi:hypothetical protein